MFKISIAGLGAARVVVVVEVVVDVEIVTDVVVDDVVKGSGRVVGGRVDVVV
jgi:hypothetical protein